MTDFESLPEINLDRFDALALGLVAVPRESMSEANIAFAMLAKRAKKRLGDCPAPALDWIARGSQCIGSHHEFTPTGKRVRVEDYCPVAFGMVTGEAPKLAGWTIAARLQTLETGEKFVRVVPGIELPERFRNMGRECEHCKVSRMRKDVFAVRNESTGEWLQVGKTCLRDFLGHDPSRVLRAFMVLVSVGDMVSEGFDGEGSFWSRTVYGTREVLERTAAVIRLEGWTSRGAADAYNAKVDSGEESSGRHKVPTVGFVRECYGNDEWAAKARERFEPIESDSNLALETLDYVRNVLSAKPGLGDYEYNLVISLKHDILDPRTLGIACSGISAYMRHLNRQQEIVRQRESRASSEYMGKEKERLRDVPVTIDFVRFIDSDFGGSTLVKMLTESGNVLSWFASGVHEFKPGEKRVLTGTVKRHTEYKGVKETQLSRCKLI